VRVNWLPLSTAILTYLLRDRQTDGRRDRWTDIIIANVALNYLAPPKSKGRKGVAFIILRDIFSNFQLLTLVTPPLGLQVWQ